jgi:hypothetical protein
MGISRRKAGTVVRCPSCASQVVVPHPEGQEQAAASPAAAAGPAPPLFERSDFDELFNMPAAREVAPEPQRVFGPPPGPVDVPKPAAPAVNVQQVSAASPPPSSTDPAAQRPGLWLTPAHLTLLSVVAIVLLALAFGLGLFIGIYVAPSSG